jgi:hypothetical protein
VELLEQDAEAKSDRARQNRTLSMDNLLGPLDKILERPEVTIMDMLEEIDPEDLAQALGRHKTLIEHLRSTGEWDNLGCTLSGLLVKRTGASNDEFSRASSAASRVLLSKTGVNLLWQSGALALLLSGPDELAPFYLNSQASLWCQTILSMLIQDSHKPLLAAVLERLDQQQFVTHLQSAAAVGLLVELAYREFETSKAKQHGEENGSLKSINNQVKSGLVGKRIHVDGIGTCLVTKFASSRIRAGLHFCKFQDNIVRKMKLERSCNGGAPFTIVGEGSSDESKHVAMVNLSVVINVAVDQLVRAATSLADNGKNSDQPGDQPCTVGLYEGTVAFLSTLTMAFDSPEEQIGWGGNARVAKHQNHVLACLLQTVNVRKIIGCIITERQVTASQPELLVQWEAQELLLLMLNKSRDLLDEQVLEGHEGTDKIFLSAQRLPGLLRPCLAEILAPVYDGIGEAIVTTDDAAVEQILSSLPRPKHRIGQLRTVVLCQQLFMALWLHLPEEVMEVIGSTLRSSESLFLSVQEEGVLADTHASVPNALGGHSSNSSDTEGGSWRGSQLDAWSGSMLEDSSLGSWRGSLSTDEEWHLGSTQGDDVGGADEEPMLRRADQAFHWRINLGEELLRLSVIPALVRQLQVASGVYASSSNGQRICSNLLLLRLQGALISALEIRLMCERAAANGGADAVEMRDEAEGEEAAETSQGALESQKHFASVGNELGRQCLRHLVRVLPSLAALDGDSKAIATSLADVVWRAMEAEAPKPAPAPGAGMMSRSSAGPFGPQSALSQTEGKESKAMQKRAWRLANAVGLFADEKVWVQTAVGMQVWKQWETMMVSGTQYLSTYSNRQK